MVKFIKDWEAGRFSINKFPNNLLGRHTDFVVQILVQIKKQQWE
jgi:hypothetical protein